MKELYQQVFSVQREQREAQNGHKAIVIWFIGLSGSGKSSISNRIALELFEEHIQFSQLDGDNTRLGINKDLDFSQACRTENLRRVAEIAKLNLESGLVTLASFITPLETDRRMIRNIIGKDNIIEVFVHAPLALCITRDVKGLYKKALNGELNGFTGIDAPFETPSSVDLILDTQEYSLEECSQKLMTAVRNKLDRNG